MTVVALHSKEHRAGRSGKESRYVRTMAGLGDKVEGKAKEIKGKVTDDKSTEVEGKAQQAAGKVKDTADDIADEVRDQSHTSSHR